MGGVLGHYSNGVAIAVIYAALSPSLFGPNWFRGLSFATVQTIMNVWLLLFPLLGMGIAGIEGGIAPAVISLLRHYAFIVPAILLLNTSSSTETTGAKGRSTVAIGTVSTFLMVFMILFSGQEARASEAVQTQYKTVEVKGVDIFYREAGDSEKPTLLLLHGFPTSSHMFRNLIEDLSDAFHLVAPDYPGF